MKKCALENFSKFTGKHLWFAKFSKTPFLQNTSARLLLLLAFQKQPPVVFYGKRCSWRFSKIHRKTPFVCKIFKNIFSIDHLWGTASGFFVQRYLNGILPTVFGKPQMNIHCLETLTLEVPLRYVIFFISWINFQCIPSLVYTVYCQKQPSE